MVNNRNTFVISPSPFTLDKSWKSKQLSDDVVFSYTEDSCVEFGTLSDGVPFALIGFCVSVIDKDPKKIISDSTIETIDKNAAFLSGRWALLTSDTCFSDASGLMSLFYREVEGTTYLSNSPQILGKHFGKKEAERINWDIVHGPGVDWIPSPYSTRKGVYRLLSQRKIKPLTGKIEIQRPDLDNGPDLVEALSNALKQWIKIYPDTWIALTAGMDTRTILGSVDV